MSRKTIIIGWISFVLLLATTFSVSAADEDKIVLDLEDDVIDFEGEDKTDQKPNIDIISLTYSKTGRFVTIDLEVKGVIENRGSIDFGEDPDPDAFDTVVYNVYLSTSENDYDITYVNEECTLNGGELSVTYNNDGSILTFSFRVSNADETYITMLASTLEANILGFYYDDVLDEGLLALIGDSYSGKVGESIDFLGIAYGGIEPYSYLWDFGDGAQSDELETNHSYETKGTYTTILTVTDYEGNTSSATAIVTISDNGDKDDDSSDSGLIIFLALIIVFVVVGVAVVVYVIKK